MINQLGTFPSQLHVSAIIPAKDEALAIGKVVADLKQLKSEQGAALIDDIIVCDNASTDRTSELAQKAGARVTQEPETGYGAACMSGIAALGRTDIVLFVDGDDSCDLTKVETMLTLVARGVDLVIGSRFSGNAEPGAMTLSQRIGTRFSCGLLSFLFCTNVTDLGPLRAVCKRSLDRLGMSDRHYGWTVEMQAKAIIYGLVHAELPVDYRVRVGISKISGTWRGVYGAGKGIISTVLKLWWQHQSADRGVGSHKTKWHASCQSKVGHTFAGKSNVY